MEEKAIETPPVDIEEAKRSSKVSQKRTSVKAVMASIEADPRLLH